MSKAPNYLFVHKNCQHSTRFINVCRENPKAIKDVEIVDIEVNRTQLPPWLTKVPTLETPDKIFHGLDAFDWLHKQLEENQKPTELGTAISSEQDYCDLNGDAAYTISSSYSTLGEKQGSEGVDASSFQESKETIDLDSLAQQRKEELFGIMGNDGGPQKLRT